MNRNVPGTCLVCKSGLTVTEVECSRCGTTVRGRFSMCKFCRLDDDDLSFLDTFVKCRGNIKEVERELGISYPTVRGRLDRVIELLGHRVRKEARSPRVDPGDVVDRLDRGEIPVADAIAILKGEKKHDVRGPDEDPEDADGG